MNKLREKVKEIALDVVHHVKGENVQNGIGGITLDLPTSINGHIVLVRAAWSPSSLFLDFILVGVYDENGAELEKYINHELVTEQINMLNEHYESRLKKHVLRKYGFCSKEQLRSELRK